MKRFLTFLVLFAAALGMYAQNSVKVQAPNLVGLDEQFNVSFVISGEHSPSSFEWQPGDDFQLVWGPQKGTSTSVSIINGKQTKSSQTTYTYILMPRKAGSFTLPSATITVKGETINSKPVTVEVVANGASQSSQQQSSSGQQAGSRSQSQSGAASGEDLFMRMSVSKSRAVVGETLTATLKLYQRVDIAGFEDVKFPTFSGFWSQELQAPTNIEFHRENINNAIYNAAVLRSWTLIPQQAGEIRIDPAELVCLVNVRTQHQSTGSIFDSFFQDDFQTIRKRVTSGAVTVNVSRLPAGAPDSFGGGVGKFKMAAELTKDSLSVHDAASLKVTVTGSGNLALIEAPKVSFPSDFEVYDVKTSDVSGAKVFEYPFIPRSHGEFDLAPVEMTYYDVKVGKYVILKSDAMHLKVSKGSGAGASSGPDGAGVLMASPSNRKDVRDLGTDIRYISTDMPALSRKGWFFVGSGLFWAILALLVAGAVVLYFALRGMAARRADVIGSRRRSATKMARKRLSMAGGYLAKDLYSAFYEELHKALLGYVSDKLSMDAAEMSKENIAERLHARGVGEDVVNEFISLLDACDFARYSPSAGHEAMNAHYESAVNAISAIDESMRRKVNTGAVVSAMVLLLAVSVPAGAATESADSLWNAGVGAYAEGRIADARASWECICALGLESSDLYCNIGDTYFKEDDLAHAILYYERALKLNPSNATARFNLDFANSMTQDKIEAVPEFFLETFGRKMCWLLPSGVWAVLSLILFAGALALCLVFLLASRPGVRKTGFFVGLFLLLAAFVSVDFAFWQCSDYRNESSAIVVNPVASAKSSPGSSSAVDLFVLHEGTKVRIVDEVGTWRNIELADGRQGWMESSELEEVIPHAD